MKFSVRQTCKIYGLMSYLIASTPLTCGQSFRFTVSTGNLVGRQELIEAHAVVLLVALLHKVFRGQLQQRVRGGDEVLLNIVHDQWAVLSDFTVLYDMSLAARI